MIDIRVGRNDSLDSQFFIRDTQKTILKSIGINKVIKVNKLIEEYEMLKFLGLSSVECV